MSKQTETEKSIIRVQKSIQQTWDKIVALSYLHPELKDTQDYLNVVSAVIYLSDVTGQMRREHTNNGR